MVILEPANNRNGSSLDFLQIAQTYILVTVMMKSLYIRYSFDVLWQSRANWFALRTSMRLDALLSLYLFFPVVNSSSCKMHSGLCSISVKLNAEKDLPEELLTEMFVAPCNIVQSFAKFLANRGDDETFKIKGRNAFFQDCSVSCQDSPKAIAAFNCLKNYNLPLSTWKISESFTKNAKPEWSKEAGFQNFVVWHEGPVRGSRSEPSMLGKAELPRRPPFASTTVEQH
jgi:hypothetical protein